MPDRPHLSSAWPQQSSRLLPSHRVLLKSYGEYKIDKQDLLSVQRSTAVACTFGATIIWALNQFGLLKQRLITFDNFRTSTTSVQHLARRPTN
jgi:hypothetical protein